MNFKLPAKAIINAHKAFRDCKYYHKADDTIKVSEYNVVWLYKEIPFLYKTRHNGKIYRTQEKVSIGIKNRLKYLGINV